MGKPKYPSEEQERFIVRMPEGMRDQLKSAAAANNRSMNAEIVARLESSFEVDAAASDPDQTIKALWPLLTKAIDERISERVSRAEGLLREILEHEDLDPTARTAIEAQAGHMGTLRKKRSAKRGTTEHANPADEDAADAAIYAERKAALAAGSDATFPAEVSAEIRHGASRLQAIRKWRGKSPMELAEAAGVAEDQVAKFEAGTATPTDAEVDLLADVLEVPTNWIA